MAGGAAKKCEKKAARVSAAERKELEAFISCTLREEEECAMLEEECREEECDMLPPSGSSTDDGSPPPSSGSSCPCPPDDSDDDYCNDLEACREEEEAAWAPESPESSDCSESSDSEQVYFKKAAPSSRLRCSEEVDRSESLRCMVMKSKAKRASAPAAKPPPKKVGAGLQLARVSVGGEVGRAGPEHDPPEGAKRKAGVAVRATWLHYGVAADGKIDAERVQRFAKQIAFRRRELGLEHGSLVSGIGSWGGPENCPIKLFGFRLTDAADAVQGSSLQVIRGVSQIATPSSLPLACKALDKVVPGVQSAAKAATTAAVALQKMCGGMGVGREHIAALYLYTMETAFYRSLNAAMRDTDRSKAEPYFGYLRLLFDALELLGPQTQRKPATLFRGVGLDLSKEHGVGADVYWWGASSCTPNKSVAQGFLGCSGKRTMFTVKPLTAVPIKQFSAFQGEEEWLLRPGTRLRVESMQTRKGGLTEVTLCELPPPRGVE